MRYGLRCVPLERITSASSVASARTTANSCGQVSIALDRNENVYVADQWLHRISIFDKDGEFLDKWGSAGGGDGQLNQPFGIAFEGEENLCVVDSNNNRVQRFTKDGKFLQKWGEAGSGPGQFNLPWGIALDQMGNVYVAEWRNDRIQKFTANGEISGRIRLFREGCWRVQSTSRRWD